MKLLRLVTTLVLCGVVLANEDDDGFYIDKDGDFILGGLFALHLRGHNENTCGAFESMPGYHLLQAMLYAIDKINSDTKLLPNITLGAKIYDSCYSQVIGARMTKKIITLTLVPPDSGQLVGVIGAHSSDLSKVVADFLRVFEIPQISYASTATTLSDKTIYSYFFRTVSPDTQQAMALASIVIELGWNYVITINSDGLYGEKGMEDFRDAAKARGICIAQRLTLKSFPSQQDFDELVIKMNGESSARAVVMFTELRDTGMILEALQRNNITKTFYWIASDGWGNNLNAVEKFESYAEGAITLTQLNEQVRGFSEYFGDLNVYDPRNSNDSWLKGFWEIRFQCNLPSSISNFSKNCSGDERLASREIEFAPVQTVVNAVFAMAHALHDYVNHSCTSGDCREFEIDRTVLLQYLKNVSFTDQATGKLLEFDKNQEISGSYSIFSFQKSEGSYAYVPAGTWDSSEEKLTLDVSKLTWPHYGANPPDSVCAEACSPGQYRQRKGSHDITCCWTCQPCKSREIVMNNTCHECPYGAVPNANQSDCMALPMLNALKRGSSQALLTISVLGLVFVIIAACIFFSHSNVPLIKASSRELSGIILLGLALLFIFPWLLVAKPTSANCICQPLILGVALASCYAPLFMKILRIYRIFKSARKSAGKPILISPTSQVLIAVALITIQLLFSLISFFPTPPKPEIREVNDGEALFLECSVGKDVFATLLSYNMFLMILCTVMAFKTRKFPRNFNEAKYIGFTMYFTCFVWIIFFPSYLSSGNGLERIVWEGSAVILIGWITLIGLFGPKVCHLVLGSHMSNTSDQLAVTNNTVSQAAVVQVSYNITNSTMDAQVMRAEDAKENVVAESEEEKQPKAVMTAC